jgi:hypothetical protein
MEKFWFDKSGKEVKAKIAEIPCQNCGTLVNVRLPFYGCVFCSDCMKFESFETADAPEFKEQWSE